jgi:hypothetical protein
MAPLAKVKYWIFYYCASGSRNGDLGALSTGVISDRVEQISDVLTQLAIKRPPPVTGGETRTITN